MYLYNLENTELRTPILVKEKMVSGRNTIFNSPQLIVDMFNTNFNLQRKSEEYVYLLCADCKMHITGIFKISHGIVNCSFMNPREIFIRACLCGATHIITVHNHPSGDPTPSSEDMATWKRLDHASEIMGITLIDNIIVGEYSYYSLKENNI